MITEKHYQVVLLNGSVPSQLYETRQEALRAHRGNISKLVEVIPKTIKKKEKPSSEQVLLISHRSIEDLEISLECGYAVMYNCPSKEKIYEGMKYLEVSQDFVLEGEIRKLEKYEKSAHPAWSGITPRFPEKIWKFSVFHKNSKIIPRNVAEEKYNNPLKGTQGGISYINI